MTKPNNISYLAILTLFFSHFFIVGCANPLKENMGRCEFVRFKYYDHQDTYLFNKEIRYCLDAK